MPLEKSPPPIISYGHQEKVPPKPGSGRFAAMGFFLPYVVGISVAVFATVLESNSSNASHLIGIFLFLVMGSYVIGLIPLIHWDWRRMRQLGTAPALAILQILVWAAIDLLFIWLTVAGIFSLLLGRRH